MCFSVPFEPMLPLQKKTIPRKSAHLQVFLNYFYTKAITNSESITYIYTQILQHLFVNQCQILFRIYICVFHEPTSSPMKCFKQRSSPSNLIIQFDLDLKLNNQYQCITPLKYSPPPTQWLNPYFYQPFTLGPVSCNSNFSVSLWSNPALLWWGVFTLPLGL